MILTDIYVPVLDRVYDFKLDENATTDQVIDEICELICRKEKLKAVEGKDKMLLCSVREQRTFAADETLLNAGVVTGDRLILL